MRLQLARWIVRPGQWWRDNTYLQFTHISHNSRDSERSQTSKRGPPRRQRQCREDWQLSQQQFLNGIMFTTNQTTATLVTYECESQSYVQTVLVAHHKPDEEGVILKPLEVLVCLGQSYSIQAWGYVRIRMKVGATRTLTSKKRSNRVGSFLMLPLLACFCGQSPSK